MCRFSLCRMQECGLGDGKDLLSVLLAAYVSLFWIFNPALDLVISFTHSCGEIGATRNAGDGC
jgi:hypothetical protein